MPQSNPKQRKEQGKLSSHIDIPGSYNSRLGYNCFLENSEIKVLSSSCHQICICTSHSFYLPVRKDEKSLLLRPVPE
jgi:hypothetical protein